MGNLQIIAVLVKNIELSCLFITFNVGFAYEKKRKKHGSFGVCVRRVPD